MLLKLALAAIGIYLVIALAMFFGQRRLLYFPDPVRTAPASVGLDDVQERIIETADGARLIAWYGPAKPGQPTLLYFHGNGGALVNRAERIAAYLERGRGVFMLAYRGYAGSSGSPSEAANVADARLAYDALRNAGVSAGDIIVYGESLGTGVAVQLLAGDGMEAVRGLILDSPFTSVVERAGQLYPWLPVGLAMRDTYRSDKAIASVRVPVLIVHGEDDQVVPVEMGRRLFAMANEPKRLVTLAGAGHNDHYLYGSFEAINAWIDDLK